MSVFANHFGSDDGKELFTVLGGMNADERLSFLVEAEATNPGITEEYNVNSSMEKLGNTSVIKGFGSALAYTSEGLAGLSADIDTAMKSIEDIEKGTIDEHLLTIEQMSGIDITAKDESGKRLYDSPFEYLKSAERAFKGYLDNIASTNQPAKHIKHLENQFKSSYDALWPDNAPKSYNKIYSAKDFLRGEPSMPPIKSPVNVSQDLKDLYELNVIVEDYQAAYDKQFIDPVTKEQSSIAKEQYEASIK